MKQREDRECSGARDWRSAHLFSELIPGFPDEENENGNHSDHDKHPVLNLESQKSEMLDQKMHRSAPQFLGRIGVSVEEIYYFYTFGASAVGARSAGSGGHNPTPARQITFATGPQGQAIVVGRTPRVGI
jgi:hypothetical protein